MTQLSRTVDCFSPLAVRTAPLSTVRASPQGEGFQVSSRLIPPSSVSECVESSVRGLVLGGSQGQYQYPIGWGVKQKFTSLAPGFFVR